MSARSARTAICVAQCCSDRHHRDGVGAAGLGVGELVLEADPELGRARRRRACRAGCCCRAGTATSSPACWNHPSCWATNSPVWLVLGVQSSATRIGVRSAVGADDPAGPAPPQAASERERPGAVRGRGGTGGRDGHVSSLRRCEPDQVITVDGRPCRPLSLGARLPRVRADDNPQRSHHRAAAHHRAGGWCWHPRRTQASTGAGGGRRHPWTGARPPRRPTSGSPPCRRRRPCSPVRPRASPARSRRSACSRGARRTPRSCSGRRARST